MDDYVTTIFGCGTGATWDVCSKAEGTTEQGLCDMAGNVREIVADKWNDNYDGAPTDGSAWTDSGDEDSCVARGGGFYEGSGKMRTTDRTVCSYAWSNDSQGFRCAR